MLPQNIRSAPQVWDEKVASFAQDFVSLGKTLGGISPALILVPGGSYWMGNSFTNLYPSEGFASELPPHEVSISTFFVSKFEVTNEEMAQTLQWAYTNGLVELDATVVTNVSEGVTNIVTNLYGTVSNTEGTSYELVNLDSGYCQISFTNDAFVVAAGKTNFPCVFVSWYGALAYCNYLSDQVGLSRAVDFNPALWSVDIDVDGYRLPTEAEWEKACRGGQPGTHYPWPDDSLQGTNIYPYSIDPVKANYRDIRYGMAQSNHPAHPWFFEALPTTPVGYYNGSQVVTNVATNILYRGADYGVVADMANGFGAYDMAGNVYEWCLDYLSTNWYSTPEAGLPDPTGPIAADSFHTQRVVRGGSWTTYSVIKAPDPSFQRCSFRTSFPSAYDTSFVGFRVVRRFQLSDLSSDSLQLSMTYGGVSGDVYIVESTTNLTDGASWTEFDRVTNSGTGTEEIHLDMDSGKRLFRLNAGSLP